MSKPQKLTMAEVDAEHGEKPKVKGQWTVGRAPWYNSAGRRKKPFLIGITGGTASGKTTVCEKIIQELNIPWVILLSMDRYYKTPTPEQMKDIANYNFDHPNAFDWDALEATLIGLKKGQRVEVPIYDFKTHSRLESTDTLYGGDVVVVEGIFVLYDKKVRDLLDMKIFVDTDADLRLARRLRRDIVERGRSVDSVLTQYITTVKPSFDEFIAPTKQYADLVIPRGGDNYVAIHLLVEHVRSQLRNRGVQSTAATEHLQRLRTPKSSDLLESKGLPHDNLHIDALPSNVKVLKPTGAIRHLHTVIRDRNTCTSEFAEAVDRLAFLLFAEVLNYVPYEKTSVVTPTDATFSGLTITPKLCGVAIVRGGDALMEAFQLVAPDAPLGKIVVQQSSEKTEGPRLYYCKLPPRMSDSTVVLADATISTANSVAMAIHVLLDHGVREENIIVATLLCAPQGLFTLMSQFPRITVVTSMVDQGLDGMLFVKPGLGSFGDRYFGESVCIDMGKQMHAHTTTQEDMQMELEHGSGM